MKRRNKRGKSRNTGIALYKQTNNRQPHSNYSSASVDALGEIARIAVPMIIMGLIVSMVPNKHTRKSPKSTLILEEGWRAGDIEGKVISTR